VNNRPRVVIVSGGFGGLYAARGLARGSPRCRPAAVLIPSGITVEKLLISGGLRYIVPANGSATGKGTKT
jgi:hypothetical protein